MYRIGVDTGGTFTDCVIIDAGGNVGVGKALSTHDDLAVGICNSIENAARTIGITLDAALQGADLLAHATTVGINALLTGRGAKVGLVTTAGFEATVPIARGNKTIGIEERFRTEAAHWEKPALLLSRRDIVGLDERIDAHGTVLRPLDDSDVRRALGVLRERGVQAIAVSLLWSIIDPTHERRVAEIAAEELPGVHITLSHALAPRIGEYERTMTALLNAYVAPLVSVYIDRLREVFAARGFRGRFVVTQSSGGVQDAARIVHAPVDTLNSGPVGGVCASLDLGRRLGHRNVVATDVGGTSFDVGIVAEGRLQYARRPMIGMYPLATPVVDLTSIGTGGGSIAWIDDTLGTLRVGPQSAGADPGPACYGRGGTRPTVTDAAVALGYLTQLGGALQLDPHAARTAIAEAIAGPLGISIEQAADDILRVANAQMADLVRRSTVQRGHDPADFALYAYGGAAPQYAGRYAADLGVAEVVIPSLASVFSAYGAAATDLRSMTLLEIRPEPIESAVTWLGPELDRLEAQARADVDGGAGGADGTDAAAAVQVERRISLRFARQVHSLPVVVDGPLDPVALAVTFRREYERLVGAGTAFASAGIEVVNVTVEARAPIVTDAAIAGMRHDSHGTPTPVASRDAWFDGATVACPVYDGAVLPAGARLTGPAFVELPTTTLVVYPGHVAVHEASGDIRLLLPTAPNGTVHP